MAEGILGTLYVYVNSPPLEGRTNNAIIKALSKYFNVRKSCVLFISGTKSKTETFKILKD